MSAGELATEKNELMKLRQSQNKTYSSFESIQYLVQSVINVLYGEDNGTMKYDLPLWIVALVASAAVLMMFLCIFIIFKKCRVKSVRSTADLPWSATRVKIFANFGRKKKAPRSGPTPQKYWSLLGKGHFQFADQDNSGAKFWYCLLYLFVLTRQLTKVPKLSVTTNSDEKSDNQLPRNFHPVSSGSGYLENDCMGSICFLNPKPLCVLLSIPWSSGLMLMIQSSV